MLGFPFSDPLNRSRVIKCLASRLSSHRAFLNYEGTLRRSLHYPLYSAELGRSLEPFRYP